MSETRIYVASRASVPDRGRMWRGLRAANYNVISTWIDEDGEGDTEDFGELWLRIQREVRSADRLILYVGEGDFPLKGALIEVGIALGYGIPVLVVLDQKIVLDGRTYRPIGSWIKHPLVSIVPDIESAARMALP